MMNVILDTDIGSDCDDAGALAVLHTFAAKGRCDILAVTHCLSRESGPAAIDAINRYYGRGDIPIGTLKLPGYLPQLGSTVIYSDILQQQFETAYPPGAPCEDATALLRRTLAAQPDGSVQLAAIGPLTNLRLLMQSPPDRASPLAGDALFHQKAARLCIMGGLFQPGIAQAEFNIASDVESARYVFENTRLPVEILPWEAADGILTGQALLNSGDECNPVYVSYQSYCGTPRASWDPCTVLYLLDPAPALWRTTGWGAVTVDGEGVTRFEERPGGHARIVTPADPEAVRQRLEAALLPKSTTDN